MDLKFTAEEEAFRSEVLAFLNDRLPQRLASKVSNGRHLTRDRDPRALGLAQARPHPHQSASAPHHHH